MTELTSLAGKKIVVVGGGGFIGTRLVRVLAERENARVTAAVRSTNCNSWNDLGNVKLAKSVRSAAATAHLVAGAHAVVNLAYDFSASSEELLSEFEVLLQACEAAPDLKAFVQFSSIAVYDGWPGGTITEDSPADGPGGLYKLTKRAMEQRLARSRLPHTILQPTIVYGAGSPQWTEKILEQFRTGTVVLPDGEEGLCHAVHVDDVVNATLLALRQASHSGSRYIVSGPESVGWRMFYTAHADVLGKPPPRLEMMPATPARPQTGKRQRANPLRGAIRAIRTFLPPGVIRIGRHWVSAIRNGGRPIIHRPSSSDLELLRARGTCSIECARKEIGYLPKTDFGAGMQRVAEDHRRPA